MITGEQYLGSLRDGRDVYLDGERVDDVTVAPGLGDYARLIAEGYDRFYLDDPSAYHPMFDIPRSIEDLRARVELLVPLDVTAELAAVALALLTAAPALATADPVYRDRILTYWDDCRRRDVRFAELITDAKGDRMLPASKQDDPDLYLRVVDRDDTGIYISGAKFHITCGPIVQELVILPTKRMKVGEEDYAVACAVPAHAPGVVQIATSFHPRSADHDYYPVSKTHAMPDSLVILDRVHVPYERVFLDGEVEHSAAIAHALGLWERLSGCAEMAHVGELLVGLAQLVAEANGTAGISHIKEKIADMVLYSTLCRASLEAAIANAKSTDDGMVYPDELYTNAGKYVGASQYAEMVRNLHDIAGGTVVTAPSTADYANPKLRPYIDKYLRTKAGVSGEYRMRLYHVIRDLTADAWGGREAVSWLQSGGGLFAQRTVLRKHFDMEAAKALALRTGGLTDLAPKVV